MLIKFTSGGRGGGGAVCNYLVDAERTGREHCPPEVVRGDLARTQELIDSIERQWTYTHGVLSFAPEDAPSVAEQAAAMDQSWSRFALRYFQPGVSNFGELPLPTGIGGGYRIELDA